jgi:hypothetical protein
MINKSAITRIQAIVIAVIVLMAVGAAALYLAIESGGKVTVPTGVPKEITVTPGGDLPPVLYWLVTALAAAAVAVPIARKQRGAIRGAVLFIVILGVICLFFLQPHGIVGSPIQCFPHREFIWVGYLQTSENMFQIAEADKIVQFSYAEGPPYSVYLMNDHGQRFEYYYVTKVQLNPTMIVTMC